MSCTFPWLDKGDKMVLAYSIQIGDPAAQRARYVKRPSSSTVERDSNGGLIIDFDAARERLLGTRWESTVEDEPENTAMALRSMPLSEEGAAAMERLLADKSTPSHRGAALPTVSAEELLRRLRG